MTLWQASGTTETIPSVACDRFRTPVLLVGQGSTGPGMLVRDVMLGTMSGRCWERGVWSASWRG